MVSYSILFSVCLGDIRNNFRIHDFIFKIYKLILNGHKLVLCVVSHYTSHGYKDTGVDPSEDCICVDQIESIVLFLGQ